MVRFVKKSFCLFLVLGFHIDGLTQSDPFGFYNKNTTLPTSPEAALMERFGDIPISYYTGTADIFIPLYTIKEAGLEIPIVLRYHSSGIKVQDQASWVGLGWSLEPEGMIVQSVMGEEDRSDNLISSHEDGYNNLKERIFVSGTYSETYSKGREDWEGANLIESWSVAYNPLPDDDPYRTLTDLKQGKGQPDIYHYNFAGYSGKFYINPETGMIVMIDKKEDLSFSQEWSFPYEWEVTTMDGHIFHFSALEESSSYVVTENKGYTWKVTKIILNNGKEINFNYLDGHYTWPIYNETWTDNFNFGNNAYFRYSDITQHNTKTLSQIETPEAIIDFNLEDREDINMGSNDDVKRLKSIDIKLVASGDKIRSFNFSYSYFPYSSVGGSFANPIKEVYGKRLKLDAIQEVGYTSLGVPKFSKPPYSFEYDMRVILPLKTSFSQDFYGYYNGASNDKLIPDLTYFYDASAVNYGSNVEFPEPIKLSHRLGKGADRMPDTTKAIAGILKKIVYPTGGYTIFDYEPNSFSNFILPNKSFIEESSKHFRVEDTNVSSDQKSKQFTLRKTTRVKLSPYISNGLNSPPLQYNDLPPESAYIKFEKIKTINGIPIPSLVKQWDMSTVLNTEFAANGGKRWEEMLEIEYEPDVYYRITAAFPDELGPQNGLAKFGSVGCVVSYYDDSEIDKTSYQCGVRIRAVRNYSVENQLLSHKSIRYINEDGATSGLLMQPYSFLYKRHMWNTTKAGWEWITTDAEWYFMSSQSIIGGGNNHVGYSRVEEISLDKNGNPNGKKVYKYINQPYQYYHNLPSIENLENGFLQEEHILDSANSLLEKYVYRYKRLPLDASYFFGIKIYNKFTGAVDPWLIPTDFLIDGHRPLHKNGIQFYLLNSEWNVLDKKISRKYMDGIALETEERFYYNEKGQVIKQVFDDKQGNIAATHTTYPVDVTQDDTQERREQAVLLKSVSLHNNILNYRQLFNGKEISELKFFYRQEYGFLKAENIVQNKIQQSYDDQPFFTKAYFEKFGGNKSLRQFTENGITTSMLWNDTNSNVIAAVKNAAVDDIAYSGFENNEKGNWAYDVANIDTVYSHTGRQSYLLNNSIPISKPNLKINSTYIVSYWTDNTSSFIITGTIDTPMKGATIGDWTYYEHKITGQNDISINGLGHVDELRLYPLEAEMTTYTYHPLIGISSVTDANNTTSSYEYDDFGRLEAIRGQDGEVIKHLKYNYQIK